MRREEDEGNEGKEWRLEPAAVSPLGNFWHQNIGEGEEKAEWEGVLQSAASTYAIWIELGLEFQ